VVKISEEGHLMAAWRHTWTVSDQEKDGFQSSNLNSTKSFPPMTKVEPSVDQIHYWEKERRHHLTTSEIWLHKCITIKGIRTLCTFRHT